MLTIHHPNSDYKIIHLCLRVGGHEVSSRREGICLFITVAPRIISMRLTISVTLKDMLETRLEEIVSHRSNLLFKL